MWEDTAEALCIEPLNWVEGWAASPPAVAAASKLIVGSASPPSCEQMIYTLPKETIMASSEAVAMQDSAGSLQDLLPQPLFASSPISRLRSQQVPTGKVQSMTREEVCATPK